MRFQVCLILAALPLGLIAQRNRTFDLGIENLYSGEAVSTFDLRPRGTEGRHYLYPDTLRAAILLANGKALNGVRARYNLLSRGLEVYLDDKEGEIPGKAIREFTLEEASGQRHRLVATSSLPGNRAVAHLSFVEVLKTGVPALLAGYALEVVPANYVPALDAGSLSDKYTVQTLFYLFDERMVQEIPRKRKEAEIFFTPYLPGIREYLRREKPNLRDADDLRAIFTLMQGAGQE